MEILILGYKTGEKTICLFLDSVYLSIIKWKIAMENNAKGFGIMRLRSQEDLQYGKFLKKSYWRYKKILMYYIKSISLDEVIYSDKVKF